MKWTKLKQKLEARFVPELNGRLELRYTRYHHAHDSVGETYLTMDGSKIYCAGYYKWLIAQYEKKNAVGGELSHGQLLEIDKNLATVGLVADDVLQTLLFNSLNQSIQIMLASQHPIIRGLAIVDTRCGRRRLTTHNMASEHELVRSLATLRLEATNNSSANAPTTAAVTTELRL